MSFIESTALIIGTFLLITALGLGPILSCLPREMRCYTLFVAPATGYISFCFFSIWSSGFSGVSVLHSNIFAFVVLLIWALYGSFLRRNEWRDFLYAGKFVPVILILMLTVVFFPALHQGIDLYLGAVNPDFYQSLSFQEALVRFDASFWVRSEALPLSGPFLDYFPKAFQARFGGVAFSLFLEQLSGFPSRTCLMAAIIVFLCCLPLVVYFFSRLVLEFDQKTSFLAAVLIIVAAPISMSFLLSFVGQNSALATIPLAISFAYLALRERNLALVCLTVLIVSGIFWLYVMALPYVLAPVGLFLLVSTVKLGKSYVKWLFLAIGCAFIVLTIVHGPIITLSTHFIMDLRNLLNKVVFESYLYLDFLTEDVLSYANGLTSFPLSQSMLFHKVPMISAYLLFLISIILGGIYFISVRLWSKTVSSNATTIFLCMITTYIIVWINYTFFNRYGYASFKMISWLQFLAVPFFAWSIIYFVEKISKMKVRAEPRLIYYVALLLLIPGYVGLNLMSDIDYAMKSYGHDRYYGSLINSYGVANNKDYPKLPLVLKNQIPTGSSVATVFSDCIENLWVAYYLDKLGAQVRIVSHELLPLDDAYLPDMKSRKFVDFRGEEQFSEQKYFHSGEADYYLLPGQGSWNKDIVENGQLILPQWSNASFALYRKEDIKDLVVIGSGFFRVEYMNRDKINWWWPKEFRWTSEGGEIFHLFPSLPGQPYQIKLSVISGLGLADGRRTLEFWNNGKKFDEIPINGVAKIVSKPYEPIEGFNRLVIRVKEPPMLDSSRKGLWNRDLPRRSRQISLLVSNVNLTHEVSEPSSNWVVNEHIEAKQMFDMFDTFNGFNVDGWVRDRAELSMTPPFSAAVLQLNISVPGWLGFKFPYMVKFILNGTPHIINFSVAGQHVIDLDFTRIGDKKLKLDIRPSESKQLADGVEQREVLQSIRLNSIGFIKNKNGTGR